MSKVNVKLTIGGIPINIKVDSENERYLRLGAKAINDDIARSSETMTEKEYGYFLAIAALKQAAFNVQHEDEIARIDSINNMLDKVI